LTTIYHVYGKKRNIPAVATPLEERRKPEDDAGAGTLVVDC